jgi:hypothetical protein
MRTPATADCRAGTRISSDRKVPVAAIAIAIAAAGGVLISWAMIVATLQ